MESEKKRALPSTATNSVTDNPSMCEGQGTKKSRIVEDRRHIATPGFNIVPGELTKVVLQHVNHFQQMRLRRVSTGWSSILRSKEVMSIALMDIHSVCDFAVKNIQLPLHDDHADWPTFAMENFERCFLGLDIRIIIYNGGTRDLSPDAGCPPIPGDYEYCDYIYNDANGRWFEMLHSVCEECPNLERLIITDVDNCFDNEIDTESYPLTCPLTVTRSVGWLTLPLFPKLHEEGSDAVKLRFNVTQGQIDSEEVWTTEDLKYMWPYGNEQLTWLGHCMVQLATDKRWNSWIECRFKHGFEVHYYLEATEEPTEETKVREFQQAFGAALTVPPSCLKNPRTNDWWTVTELLAMDGEYCLNVEDFLTMSAYILARDDLLVPRPPQKFDFETDRFYEQCRAANEQFRASENAVTT